MPVSRRLRQLAASLDRLAGMDLCSDSKYVVVNIPAAIAEAVENGRVVRRHATIVGKPDRPSPTLTTHLTAVNLNPTWTVPLSILKKDIRTKMRRDPGYVSRMRMRVLDGAGREIDPKSVDWHSDGAPNFTVRQDSGSHNALGAVRFDMPNPYSVYLHDTNNRRCSMPITASSPRAAHGWRTRATSRSGCLAIRNGIALPSTPPSPTASGRT